MSTAHVHPEVLGFVRAALPPPPARVLEVGAGRGELAAALVLAGYDVLAIDPAGHVPEVVAVSLHELEEPSASFDAAVAVTSLHHVEPLRESCGRLGALVRPAGVLVIDEFDVERYDERAVRWHDEHRAAHDHALSSVGELRAELHSVDRIRAAVLPWFEVGEPVRGAYLYRWDAPAGERANEEELIARGELPATGARLVGRRRAH